MSASSILKDLWLVDFIIYSHFVDEKTISEKSSSMPKVTQRVHGAPGTWTEGDLTPECSPHAYLSSLPISKTNSNDIPAVQSMRGFMFPLVSFLFTLGKLHYKLILMKHSFLPAPQRAPPSAPRPELRSFTAVLKPLQKGPSEKDPGALITFAF